MDTFCQTSCEEIGVVYSKDTNMVIFTFGGFILAGILAALFHTDKVDKSFTL